MTNIFSRKSGSDDMTKACYACEFAKYISLTETLICTKGTIKQVDESHFCRKFSPDLFKINPPAKAFHDTEFRLDI